MFGSGVRNLEIVYRAGKENGNTDALSQCPHSDQPAEGTLTEVQVASIHTTKMDARQMLESEPVWARRPDEEFLMEQRKDPEVLEIITFLTTNQLPDCEKRARRVAAQAPSFAMVKGVLYFLDSRHGDRRRCVLPRQMRQKIMEENHSGPMAGHFSGERLYKSLARHWWWQGMYTDVVCHCASCPQCAIVNPAGRVNRPPLHPIPVQHVFQILGVDVMDLPVTEAGNKHVVGLSVEVAFGISCTRPEGCTNC